MLDNRKNDIIPEDKKPQQPSLDNFSMELIGRLLDYKDLKAAVLTNRKCNTIFTSRLFPNARNAATLLARVMDANPSSAENYLLQLRESDPKNYWRVILHRSPGEEKNGREWEAVSALEFAAWAGDIGNTEGTSTTYTVASWNSSNLFKYTPNLDPSLVLNKPAASDRLFVRYFNVNVNILVTLPPPNASRSGVGFLRPILSIRQDLSL